MKDSDRPELGQGKAMRIRNLVLLKESERTENIWT